MHKNCIIIEIYVYLHRETTETKLPVGMNETVTEQYGQVREALVGFILERISRPAITSALATSSRFSRMDAICNALRDAVMASPVVRFSGEMHVFVPARGYYVRFRWSDLEDSLYVAMRRLGVKDGDYGRIGNFCKIVAAAVSDRECAVDTSVVVMSNGVYNTFDRQLHPFSEEFMTNTCVDFAYDPAEKSFLWQRFLDRVLPDRTHQALLQEFIASCYVLRSRVKIEQMLILLGDGQNGKSVIFEVVSSLLGEDSVTHFYLSDLIGGQRREQNVAGCKGKRLNYCSEIRTKEIDAINSDAIKTLISGEPVMGRKLFMEPEKVSSFPLLMANANTLPRLSDPSDSLRRRFLIIPFSVTIPKEEQDLELPASLKKQRTGIFNWVMEGLERLRRNEYKITIPDSIAAVVNAYFSENNPVVKWTIENDMYTRMSRITSPNSVWKLTRALYADFCLWCREGGEEPYSQNKFVKEMKSIGFIQHRTSDGAGFIFYVVDTQERARSRNLDAASSFSSDMGEKVRTYISSQGDQKVVGVNAAEKYLGLPLDTLWGYLASGSLDGTYRNSQDGPIFNVKDLVVALAQNDYFVTLKEEGEAGVKRSAGHSLKGARRVFNKEMELRGLPFRKYKSKLNVVPASAVGCILVPDNWVYTKANAQKTIEEYNDKNKM